MSIIYINGEYKKTKEPLISHRDCGFMTGIGIFDSMLVKNGKPVYAREHYERITHDTKTVTGLTPDISFNDFQNICMKLLEKNDLLTTGFARLRTTITGGEVSAPLAPAQTPTILIDAAKSDTPDNITPITCAIITDFPRIAGCVLENCKRLDYTRNYAARRMAETLGATDAILTNTDGSIACGATSNIFIEENGHLITPPLSDGILAGVTRRKIIEEHDVREESISIERLKLANKIYLTNSFIGLRKITIL